MLLFLLAAVARLAALFYFPYPEPNYYWTLAENIVTNQQFAFENGPTTYIEPLYPAFLAGARLLSGDVLWLVMLFQITVASAERFCSIRSASRWAAALGPRR